MTKQSLSVTSTGTQSYVFTWSATVHASSDQEAIDVAYDVLQSQLRNSIELQLVYPNGKDGDVTVYNRAFVEQHLYDHYSLVTVSDCEDEDKYCWYAVRTHNLEEAVNICKQRAAEMNEEFNYYARNNFPRSFLLRVNIVDFAKQIIEQQCPMIALLNTFNQQ